ncbi:MAG: serine/threonine protein kinase [Cyanobacteria bacterium J055]|nr:MAG: serine/threonine protein kinase [Cyanobacteria bacterium J055]
MNVTTGTALRHGKYEIGAVVGQGCFKIAYRATHVSSQQSVSIEALNESWRGHPQFNLFQRRFVERMRQIAKCRHPHIVRILDLFAENGLVYAVMEEIAGETLDRVLADGKPMPLRDAFQIVRQVASALRLLHQQEILHLNIKPDSIVLPKSERAVLTNFGIAHYLTPGAVQTQTGMLAPGYAPPEQYDPHCQPTPATDVYALAATLYHLLVGQPPAIASLRDRIPLVDLRSVRPEITPALELAILQGLELSQDRRSPSIEAWMNPLWREFSAIKAHPAVAAPPVEIAPPPPPSISFPRNNPSIDRRSIPPQLQPWIPALFVATSLMAGMGGASFVFTRQANSNIATTPTPELSRLRRAFPSRSERSNFGPDRDFVEAADPDTPIESTEDFATDAEGYPHPPASYSREKSDSETLPVRTAEEEMVPALDFPLEVESWESQPRIPQAAVARPEENPELAPEEGESRTDDLEFHRSRPSRVDRSSDYSREDGELESVAPAESIDIPDVPPRYPLPSSADRYFVPKTATEFSMPKHSKSGAADSDSGSWSKPTSL